MNLIFEFDEFDDIIVTEFGVGNKIGNRVECVGIPVDIGVKKVLFEMAHGTWNEMWSAGNHPVEYDPGEKYGSTDYVFVPADGEMDDIVRGIHDANVLRIDSGALNKPEEISFYFARFIDSKRQHLTAVRRASRFKGVLKSSIMSFVNDSLKIVEDQVFRLDNDFDLLVDSEATHILRPSAFEFICQLRQRILGAVSANVRSIRQYLSFVDFGVVQKYASIHPRAARYLASINKQNLAGIDRRELVKSCRDTGVKITLIGDIVTVSEKHVMGFLEVLDRRRYEVNLVPDSPERFRAGSRRRIT